MRAVTIARKPLKGGVAENALAHGCGPINIGATRVEGDVNEMRGRSGVAQRSNQIYGKGIRNPTDEVWEPNVDGRWPANVVVVGAQAVEALDAQGEAAGAGSAHTKDKTTRQTNRFGDEGGASRFYKVIPLDSDS